MIVVHGGDAVPAELIQAFEKEVPDIVAEHGFEIVDAQQRQLTEVPALTDVDAVLYVDVQRWNKDYSAVIAAESVLELEFKLVSAEIQSRNFGVIRTNTLKPICFWGAMCCLN